VTERVGTGPPAIGAAYASALRDYLAEPTEQSLREAYELGRDAVARQLSVLDLALAHQEALLSVVDGASGAEDVRQLVRTAGSFLLESLGAFEMVQRAVGEAREAAETERRQTAMSRQLSAFLSDVPLALGTADSLPEMLRLVVEQAVELLDAECGVATVAGDGLPRIAEAVTCVGDERRWAKVVQWLDLFAVYRQVRLNGGSMRADSEQLRQLSSFTSVGGEPAARHWLAASLTTFDGGELGAIQLFDKLEGGFTADDEAALVHLAQMASAAIERAQLHGAQT
jgi:Phosphoserine phosphatase RsbU, N-terminal domain